MIKTLKKNIRNNKIINDDIFKIVTDNIDTIVSTIDNIKLYEIILNEANNRYHNSTSIIDDYVYDRLLDRLKSLDPNNKIFSNIGYTVESINKVKLPYHMGSMNKIKKTDIDLFLKFIKQYNGPYLISDKLDGISALLDINNNVIKMYTRGDGTYGSDITHLIEFINIVNLNNIHDYLKQNKLKRIILRGELVMKLETFNKTYATIAANPRNFVSGQVNAKKLDGNILKDIDLVFYEIIEPNMSIDKQFNIMSDLQLSVSPFEIETINNLTLVEVETSGRKPDVSSEVNVSLDKLSAYLKRRKEISKYDIDGIIVSDINNHSRNMSGNPEYSFAFKENNVFKDATVEEVEWNISKDGFLKPRVRIVPIQLSGVQITYVTAHNAKYVYDNKIGKGSIIQITRSGDVIPYIVKIIKPSLEVQMPQILDEWQWNKSGVDIVLKSNSMNDEQLIKTLSYFVKKLDIKNMDEATFKTLVEHKIINSLSDIFRVSEFKDKLLLLDGFKEKKTLKIIKELDDGFNRMSLTDLMVASNIFGHGIGEKKINKIVSTYPNILDLAIKKSYKELYDLIIEIDGFEDITTKQFLEHLETFNDFLKNKVPKNIYNRLKKDIREIIEKDKDSLKSDKKLLGLKFVMTGFRNKTWETIIVENGGEITSTVSKNTFMLICNSLDESSNKIIKAKEHGIKILEKDAFVTYMYNTYSLLFN